MRKLLLTILLLAAAAAAARAQSTPVPTVGVRLQFSGSLKCYNVAVPSMTIAGNQAFDLVTSSAPRGAAYLIIQDQDSSVNLYVGDQVTVSTPVAAGAQPNGAGSIGLEVKGGSPTTPLQLPIVPGMAVYAVNDSTTKTVNAAVCAGW